SKCGRSEDARMSILGIRTVLVAAILVLLCLRSFSSWLVSGSAARLPQAEGCEVCPLPPWQHQQVRTRKRGTEYQPKNIKRKRTHGWIKRLSTRGGIEVILRRMLKGRKSLCH
uniref:Large ribosomal subunit protein bL34m n=1 Tax=Nothobranchius furzeri TaxID=105023 RepID=A0A8C6MDU6_NOTFU